MPPRRTILIVDDEEDQRFLARINLEHAGLLVLEAPNGGRALALLRGTDAPLPDLVVTDRAMPVMDGDAFVAAMIADPALAGIPIVQWSTRPERLQGVVAAFDKPDLVSRLVPFVLTYLQERAPT
jgi:CheY-like chemotaxis protein